MKKKKLDELKFKMLLVNNYEIIPLHSFAKTLSRCKYINYRPVQRTVYFRDGKLYKHPVDNYTKVTLYWRGDKLDISVSPNLGFISGTNFSKPWNINPPEKKYNFILPNGDYRVGSFCTIQYISEANGCVFVT